MGKFPSYFEFGAATSSYQIEGAVHEDGRGPTIWDTFSHTAGKVANQDNGDVACDHYHRYRDDVQLMKALGLQTYRFSIAWSRLFPNGRGSLNEKGLDFYQKLVEALLENGIRPTATLYHWDLPQALQDEGGWLHRDTADAFAEYADTVFNRLGDRIPRFITLNEPWCSAVLGYGMGIHAPGLSDYGMAVAAAHHLLLAHGKAVQAYRADGQGGDVGITNILCDVVPATDSSADQKAAVRMDGLLNRWYLDPVFKGAYPAELTEMGVGRLIQTDDMDTISEPIDFLGVNYYFQHRVAADPTDPILQVKTLPPQGPLTDMGWGIHPDGLKRVLLRVQRDYGPIPTYVTENGAAFADVVQGDTVHDPDRLDYLHSHLAAVVEAIGHGADVRGYYAWSLMDNFEWQDGYAKRFGLFYVDYPTQRRLWKDSARWYREVIAAREL